MAVMAIAAIASALPGATHAQSDPFRLVSISPADRSTGASRSPQLRSTFSHPVSSASLGSQSITVSRPGHLVSSHSHADGPVVTTTLHQRLLPMADYRVALSGVRSTSGAPLAGPTSTTFTTVDGQWRGLGLAHDGAGPAASGFDGVQGVHVGGGTLVAWSRVGEPGIRASLQESSGGSWSAPQLISGEGGAASDPQLVADGHGNAILVWSHLNQASPAYRVIWAARFNGGTRQWEAPRVVSHADGSHNTFARLASDGQGRVVIAWRRTDGTGDSLWWTQGWSTTSHQWSTPSRADSVHAPSGAIGSLAVGVSSTNRRIIMAWSARFSSATTVPAIWARAFGQSLPPLQDQARIISNTNGDPLVEPSVAVDGDGTGWVAWRQFGPGPTAYPTFSNVQVARFDPFGWQPAIWVSDLYAQARHVRIASNRATSGAARTWLTWVEPQRGGAVAAVQVTSGGVASSTTIGQSAVDAFHKSSLVVDDAGNVTVSWGQQADTATLMAARYAARNGSWSVPVNLDLRQQPGQAYGASLSVNVHGDLFATWLSVDRDPATGVTRTPVNVRRFD